MDNEATRIGAAGGGQLAVGSVLAHTYQIVRFIRAGGMGEVYEARHLVDNSRLAVKFIRPDLVGDERIRAMFVREAGILRRIRDEAVVGYEGLLQDEQGRSFLVMTYVDGPSLAERAQSRPLEHRGGDEAAGAARARPGCGPRRRYLPPRPVARQHPAAGGRSEPRGDHRLRHRRKLAEPQAGTLVGGDIAGKASYMSPEQLGVIRHEVDARSDIYGLALTIAAAVRGRALSTAAAGPTWSRRAARCRISRASPSPCAAASPICSTRSGRPAREHDRAVGRRPCVRPSRGSNPGAARAGTRVGRQGQARGRNPLQANLVPIAGGVAALVLVAASAICSSARARTSTCRRSSRRRHLPAGGPPEAEPPPPGVDTTRCRAVSTRPWPASLAAS